MSRYRSWLETIIGDVFLKELKTEEEIDDMIRFLLSVIYAYSFNAKEAIKRRKYK